MKARRIDPEDGGRIVRIERLFPFGALRLPAKDVPSANTG